jgi:hypothetical protein
MDARVRPQKTKRRVNIGEFLPRIGQWMTATSEREKISFHQLNKKTGHRIKYRKVDAESGDEVESADIIKGTRSATALISNSTLRSSKLLRSAPNMMKWKGDCKPARRFSPLNAQGSIQKQLAPHVRGQVTREAFYEHRLVSPGSRPYRGDLRDPSAPMFQIGAGAAGNNFGNLFRRALRTRVVL